MKRFLALAAISTALCALACAQQAAGDRVVVPARNSTRPRQVNASLLAGSITVKAYAGKEVIVESSGGPARPERNAEGMRRIDRPGGLDVTEEDNVVTVRVPMGAPSNLTISVPADTSLKLNSNHGSIDVEGVTGEVEAKSLNGRIMLTDISGAVVANSLNGELKVSMRRVDPSKPMSFSTLNGAIDVTLPADARANLKMKTDHGEIYSDFEIKLTGSGASTEKNESKDGKFRVRFDRALLGTINGGGPEISFYTLHGTINIRKR